MAFKLLAEILCTRPIVYIHIYFYQVVSGYLSLCPTRGASVGKVILPARKVNSDSEAQHIADTLRAMGLVQDADTVVCCRGMYWLREARAQANSSLVTNVNQSVVAAMLGLSENGPCGHSAAVMVARAATFFIRCRDSNRLSAIFDAALNAIISSLCSVGRAADRCSKTMESIDKSNGDFGPSTFSSISGLVMSADGALGKLKTFENLSTGCMMINKYVSEIQSRREDVVAPGKSIRDNVNGIFGEHDTAVAVLYQAIGNTKLLLDVVWSKEVLGLLSFGGVRSGGQIGSGNVGVTLMRFSEAIELILNCLSLLRNEESYKNRTLAVCALKKCCQLLVSLISDGSAISSTEDENFTIDNLSSLSIMNSVCPPRYLLFVIDICVWAYKMHSKLLLKPQQEKRNQEESSQYLELSEKVLSRRQINNILCAYHQVTDTVTAALVHKAGGDEPKCSSVLSSFSAGTVVLYIHSFIALVNLTLFIYAGLRPSILNIYLSGMVQTNASLRDRNDSISGSQKGPSSHGQSKKSTHQVFEPREDGRRDSLKANSVVKYFQAS